VSKAHGELRCFHCGGPLAPGGCHSVSVAGVARAVCCAGCEAAAELILAQGLGRFYEFRDTAAAGNAAGTSPGGALLAPPTRDWTAFDREAALRRYTHLREDGERELLMQVEGLHCAACAWLIENSLHRVPGVSHIQVNTTAARAQLRFDPRQVSLSRVLARIQVLGFTPLPLSFAGSSEDWTLERRAALKRLAVAGFGMMQVMTYAESLYAGAWNGISADLEQFLRFVSLLVATPVALYAAQPFFVTAWRSLRARTPGMDVPVALSIGGAYLWSVVATLRGRGEVYFDSVVMFTFFLLLGRYIEMSLRHRSGLRHDALARLLPDSALRISGGTAERVTLDELRAGDCIRVPPGERVPADGEVLSGETEVDESLLTGESAAQPRGPQQRLRAGTLNLTGAIELRVACIGQDTTLAAVARLLERAAGSRPRVADLADRVAVWFVSAILLLAAITAAYWLHVDAQRAFPTVLALLVVTCPCALSLATPAALAAATARLARGGLLVTRGRALEQLARADRIVFDKTGTLTRGEARLEAVTLLSARARREQCLAIAAALESRSGHPLARAFAKFAPATGVDRVRCVAGRGVEGYVDGVRYRIGRSEYVLEGCSVGAERTPPTAATQLHTSVMLGDASGLLAEFRLTDAVRSDARTTLARLRSLGLSPQIASGDHAGAVAHIARALEAPIAAAGMTAADKLALVQSLQSEGHRVVMVGDGVNDAPVIAAADVSVAIGSGTDLAKVSADIVLLGQGLGPLALAVETSRRMMRIIRQNLVWAAFYNATAVPLAAAGWLKPWMAAVGMSASSLLVVLNATRLLAHHDGHEPTAPRLPSAAQEAAA
jgi:P-type Cu2+ transporter